MKKSQINMHEAKTHLSRLVERVAGGGEEVVIARAGKPMAKLIAYSEPAEARKPGAWEGRVWMADDFDEPDEAIIGMFEGAKEEAP